MDHANTPQAPTERELPMLAGIAAFFSWIESLFGIIAGPVLTFGLGLALVDLLTDGRLLAAQPALLYVWAVSQAAGLDAQFIGSAAKMARASRQGRGWHVAGYALLCCALGYVAFLASDVFATQQADGLSTGQALARLGMDNTTWLLQRSALSVVLVFLSGFLRYVRPAAQAHDASVAAIHSQQQLGLARIHKWRSYAQAALARADAETSPDRPPTGGGTPALAPLPAYAPDTVAERSMPPSRVASVRITRRIPASRLRELRKDTGFAAYHRRGFAALDQQPDLTVEQLRKVLRCRTEVAVAIFSDWQNQRRAAVQ